MITSNVCFRIKIVLIFALAGSFIFSSVGIVGAQSSAANTPSSERLNLIVGELEAITVSSLTRVSLTEPAIADIVNVDEKEILLIGKSVGQTILFIWDDKGKRTVMIQVSQQDLKVTKERIAQLLQEAGIVEATVDINDREGKIIISGDIPDHKKADFDKVVDPFGASIINLAKKEEIQDLIQVDMQVTELSQTLSKSLGVDWTSGSGDGIALTYPETIPTFDGSIGDFFKIGDFSRTSPLLATINALVQDGKARILSKPKLVVVSGQEARFLVGGQIPFRTSTTTGSSVQENVAFKSYGIGMTITPTIKKEKIDVSLNVEISDIDSANAVGDNVAFTTRSANTHLYLDDRQTIILAGLIKHNDNETVKKVPFLGDVPVLGLLFRSKSNPVANTDTEIVISLTPTVLTKNRNDQTGRILVDEKVSTDAAAQAQESSMSESSEVPVENVPEDFNENNIVPEENLQDAENTGNAEESSTETIGEDVYVPEKQSAAASTQQGPIAKPVVSSSDSNASMAGLGPDMLNYIQGVQRKISQSIVYPSEAKEYGWEGTVKLGLLILSDGSLAYALVKDSSGYDVFDENALNTAKKVAPYASFPPTTSLMELNVSIPIVYNLERK